MCQGVIYAKWQPCTWLLTHIGLHVLYIGPRSSCWCIPGCPFGDQVCASCKCCRFWPCANIKLLAHYWLSACICEVAAISDDGTCVYRRHNYTCNRITHKRRPGFASRLVICQRHLESQMLQLRCPLRLVSCVLA